MYKGEELKGINFFNLLIKSKEFNMELGKLVLYSGRLESEMILFFRRNFFNKFKINLTLGGLIKFGETNKLFDKNLIISLNMVCKQRNYLTHNIYALFIELADVTILERENLLDTDVLSYIDKVYVLNENIKHLTEIINKM